MTRLIAVDFDKTLTDPDQDGWAEAFDQEPNPEVIEALQREYRSGKHVIVWTARNWGDAPQVAGWLHAHEVPFHGLRCCKGGADAYIDDKMVSVAEFIDNE